MKNQSGFVVLLLVLMGVVARIVGAETQWYNIAPIAAIGLFSGSVLNDKKWAFVVAIAAQFVVDVYFSLFTQVPGFYGIAQWFTYAALIAATFIGTALKRRTMVSVLGYTLSASVVFFIISNLGHFAQGWNGYSATGLVKTYTDAIPFFKNSLLGDVVGSIVLFGTYALIVSASKKQKVSVA